MQLHTQQGFAQGSAYKDLWQLEFCTKRLHHFSIAGVQAQNVLRTALKAGAYNGTDFCFTKNDKESKSQICDDYENS